jgi:hypothetical protein
MKQAVYHTPDAAPKIYACREGAVEGTIDLLNAEGRAIVTSLPVVEENAPTLLRVYGVIVSAAAPAKAPAKAKAPKKDSGSRGETIIVDDFEE